MMFFFQIVRLYEHLVCVLIICRGSTSGGTNNNKILKTTWRKWKFPVECIMMPFGDQCLLIFENSATCEIRSIIRFLNAKNTKPDGIHRHIYRINSVELFWRWTRHLNDVIKYKMTNEVRPSRSMWRTDKRRQNHNKICLFYEISPNFEWWFL